MYVAIRPALRASTRRQPARLIHRRRYPLAHRTRSFHSTRILARDPNTPPGSDNTSIDRNGADTGRGKAATADSAGLEAHDPEELVQKLQRSRELTRRYASALRRTQRRNRAQDLPPVHVPDWFLKKNVKRHDERPKADNGRQHVNFGLTISNPEAKEEATISYPVRSWSRGVENASQLVRAMWKDGLSDEQRKTFAEELARRVGAEEKEKLAVLLEEERAKLNPKLENVEDDGSEAEVAESEAGDKESLNTEAKLTSRKTLRISPMLPELEELRRRPGGRTQLADAPVSALAIAEIRAHIAASLSAIHPSMNNSFPSAKTNLILHSPSPAEEPKLLKALTDVAVQLNADVIQLDAQSLALIGGDYLGESPEPSPYSIRSLAYETHRLNADLEMFEPPGQDESFDDDPEATPSVPQPPSLGSLGSFSMPIISVGPLSEAFKSITNNLVSMKYSGANQAEGSSRSTVEQPRAQTPAETQLEDLKLSALLDALLDANETKSLRGLRPTDSDAAQQPPALEQSNENPSFFDFSVISGESQVELTSALPDKAKPNTTLKVTVAPSGTQFRPGQRSKIIHVKDMKELNGTQYGSRIIEKLEEIVRKRRSAGESIVIVGTTCSNDLTPELTRTGVYDLQSENDASLFRTIVVPTEVHPSTVSTWWKPLAQRRPPTGMPRRKVWNINVLHIQDMIRGLDPVTSVPITDTELTAEHARPHATLLPDFVAERVLTYDEVHRISLTALGLYSLGTKEYQFGWSQVALAMGLLETSDQIKYAYINQVRRAVADKKEEFLWQIAETRPAYNPSAKTWYFKGREYGDSRGNQSSQFQRRDLQGDLQRISATATKHEKRLLPGIADPDQIKTTFDQVHISKDTLDSIRTLTSMSLLRPDAFDYGVLATEKISGALLYGPPGTGKTLLAKAVAKESGSTVLEVSGSQIMDKYIGEGEKNVSAIFSLARKLSPCIVFLDEADAILATRDAARERSSHRDILNQFLKEWDGLNDLSVFVMVATNRPFDLDDAVIRRLPRRMLVDLPTQADRKEILKIHLRGEQLDESVDLEDIAKHTPFYSGSDLKNLVVSAALACVKEENEQAAMTVAKAAAEAAAKAAAEASAEASTEATQVEPLTETGDTGASASSSSTLPPGPPVTLHLVRGQKYEFPEKRILHVRHFDKALEEITASISEDMSSLSAIKKFDEQYGDKKGKKKKSMAYGFGLNAEKNENVARVRP